jgi:hypothetical protein
MANGKIPNINNKFYGDQLVDVVFPNATGSLGFDEYNAVLNNANNAVTSSIKMKVESTFNARIPTNNDEILNGTAERIEIQDSNYSSAAWSLPRYVGSKTISANYNDYQPSSSNALFADNTEGNWIGDQIINEYPGYESFQRGNPLGKVPAIDLYSTHFVLFDRIDIDSAFDDGDVFHCLYLIDDQGNKVPLTYRNKNLIDLQRIFAKGSNAEVVFLTQNNQEVLDEYPIIEVGKISSTRASFTNDLFTSSIDSNGSPIIESRFISISSAVSNAYIRHTSINDVQTDYSIRFVPSAFNIEPLGSNNYRFTYSEPNIRTAISSSGFANSFLFRHLYYRRARSGSQPTQNYAFWDGDYSTVLPLNHDSKFDPFYFLTWNPQTSKIFEGTLLEQEVEFNLFSSNPQDPSLGSIPFTDIPGYPGLNTISLGSVSQYSPGFSPIKQGDTLYFGKFPIDLSVDEQLIGTFPNQTGETITSNLREYYNVTNNIELEITNINFPFSQSIEISGIGNQVDYKFFNNNSNLIPNVSFIAPGNGVGSGTWQMFQSASYTSFTTFPGIIDNFSPNQVNLTPSQAAHFISPSSPLYGNFRLCVDKNFYQENLFFQFCPPESVHTMIISSETIANFSQNNFLESLSHGDIIEFAFCQPNPQIGDPVSTSPSYSPSVRYKILQKPFHPIISGTSTLVTGAYIVRLQYIPTENNIPIIFNDRTYTTTVSSINTLRSGLFHIKRIVKYRAPYIDVKLNQTTLQQDISGSINSSGSVMSVIQNNIHEQYITSQFLEGGGVGVLIPDNYDPKLREQLPDIINKTGININSLT